MKLISSIDELKEMDNFLSGLTEEFITPLGSVFRVVCQALKNWGIEVTDENINWIKERSKQGYIKEWESSSEKVHDIISEAIVDVGLGEGNKSLNTLLAMTIREILRGWESQNPKREFFICDIGAGTGTTTISIHNRLLEDSETAPLIQRVYWYLIEPSPKAINEAHKNLKEIGLSKYQCIPEFDDEYYSFSKNEKLFDLVVSNAVFHHKSFPDYLSGIHRILAEDGVLVFGDWYSITWYQPHTVVNLIEDIGNLSGLNGEQIAREFREFFDLTPREVEDFTKSFDKGEQMANRKVEEYKKALAERLKRYNEELGKKPTDKGALRQYILEAYEPLNDRLEKLSAHGFEIDITKLKETHKGFRFLDKNIKRLYPDSYGNLACVVAAAKK